MRPPKSYAALLPLALLLTGCALPHAATSDRSAAPAAVRQGDRASAVAPVSYQQDTAAVDPAPIPPDRRRDAVPADLPPPAADPADPFASQAELSLDALVGEVLARNPSLQAMVEAWRAAAERYPQVVSLEDPMLGMALSPTGVGHDGGYMVEASQKLPWPGKRQLRGVAAQAEAEVACRDVEDVRLQLTEAAKMAFYDYYVARRGLEINTTNAALMTEFRDIARTRYEANRVSEQDVLQATVELAELESRRMELDRMQRVAAARINTLLHREAACALPAPPAQVPLPESLPPVDVLQSLALQQRPDLAAECARIRAEQANIALACKEFYPDVEVVAKYDAFMPDDMRSQIGMNVNVPLWRERRWAAVREASARLRQRAAEYQNRVDQVRYEVQSAYERLAEGRRVVHLYAEKIVPAAQASLDSARANYVTGRVDFLRLVEANRQFYREQDRYYETLADYYRRAAELERAVGGALASGS